MILRCDACRRPPRGIRLDGRCDQCNEGVIERAPPIYVLSFCGLHVGIITDMLVGRAFTVTYQLPLQKVEVRHAWSALDSMINAYQWRLECWAECSADEPALSSSPLKSRCRTQ